MDAFSERQLAEAITEVLRGGTWRDEALGLQRIEAGEWVRARKVALALAAKGYGPIEPLARHVEPMLELLHFRGMVERIAAVSPSTSMPFWRLAQTRPSPTANRSAQLDALYELSFPNQPPLRRTPPMDRNGNGSKPVLNPRARVPAQDSDFLTTAQGAAAVAHRRLAEGRRPRAHADGRLPPPREDHALRPRAHPRARGPRPRRGSARRVRVVRQRRATSRAPTSCRPGGTTPVFTRFSTVVGSRGSADTVRDVRGLRGEVLHGRGHLRSRRQQHPGVLHPRRHQVPRPHPRRQARARP